MYGMFLQGAMLRVFTHIIPFSPPNNTERQMFSHDSSSSARCHDYPRSHSSCMPGPGSLQLPKATVFAEWALGLNPKQL